MNTMAGQNQMMMNNNNMGMMNNNNMEKMDNKNMMNQMMNIRNNNGQANAINDLYNNINIS